MLTKPSVFLRAGLYRATEVRTCPHRVLLTPACPQDDWYECYFIPKDTSTFIANVWALTTTPSFTCISDHLRPGRFLDASGTADVAQPDTCGIGYVPADFGRQ